MPAGEGWVVLGVRAPAALLVNEAARDFTDYFLDFTELRGHTRSMSDEQRPFLTITIGKREARVLLAAALVAAVPYLLFSETLTLSTTYPSPAGIYKKLIATGEAILGRDGGNVALVPASNAGGSVVIGGAAPTAKLSVAGGVSASGSIATGAGLSAVGDVATGGSVSAVGDVSAGGVVRVGLRASDPQGVPGAIYFNTATQKFMGYRDGQWKELSAPAADAGPVSGGLYGGCKVLMTTSGVGGMTFVGSTRYSCFDVSSPATCAVTSATSSTPDVCRCPSGYTLTNTGQYNTGSNTGPSYSCRKN